VHLPPFFSSAQDGESYPLNNTWFVIGEARTVNARPEVNGSDMYRENECGRKYNAHGRDAVSCAFYRAEEHQGRWMK
jgi:hypothetical protein